MPEWGWYLLGLTVGLLLLWFGGKVVLYMIRRAILMRRYDDAGMVDTILDGQIARGMSYEMVIDAWGDPADMSEKVMKTKTKRELKYDPRGRNRYGTRVFMENGAVVGWETK